MKLYTEEQVIDAITKSFLAEYPTNGNNILKQLKPIELPSDEEIEKYADYAFPDAEKIGGESYTAMRGLKIGAKWVLEQIKQQDDTRR